MRFLIRFFLKLFCCFTRWSEPADSTMELAKADVIIAQSFGMRDNKEPGLSNEALARIATKLRQRYGHPLVLQWEIADCLPPQGKEGVIREHRIKGKYLDTYEVLSQSWEICKEHGWKEAIVVAHPDHMWRVARTAEKLGFKVLIPTMPAVPYDRDSIQKWTRSRARFIMREIPSRIFYLLRGWI